MWKHLALFEIRYWLRSWVLWIFLAITTGVALWACSSSDIVIGASNCDWNAGFVVEEYYSVFSLFTLLMATVFVNSSATRDFSSRSDQIVFSTPIRKRDYLAGRFLGASFIAAIPMLGASLGVLVAPYAWWTHGDYQRINWLGHAYGILLWALPNTLFIAAILFAVAVLTRSSAMSFVSAICVLTGYKISQSYLSDLKNERIGAFLDPFGGSTFSVMTKYWTTADKNHLLVGCHGLILWNRLLWLAVGLAIFVFAYRKFQFAPRQSLRPETGGDAGPAIQAAIRKLIPAPDHRQQFLQVFRLELLSLTKTVSFFVILACSLAIILSSLITKATEGYGNTSFPVTYKVVELVRIGQLLFGIAIVLYFAGVAVWREKDAACDEMLDALPVPEWLVYLAKLCAVLTPLLIFQVLGSLTGMLVQAAHGYYRFEPGLYAIQFLVVDFLSLVFLAILAMFIHVLSPQKYVAWFAFIAFLTLDGVIWKPLNVATVMVQYGDIPDFTYSDFFGWQPYRAAVIWFTLYWAAFCALLAIATVLLWRRGRETRWRHRWGIARLRLHGPTARAACIAAAAYLAVFAVVFYNTKILHSVSTDRDGARINASYEIAYKQYEHLPQPRIVSAKCAIDLVPESSSMKMSCDEVIRNKTAQPIERLYIDYLANEPHAEVVPQARRTLNDEHLGFAIYQFTPPLQPGESRTLTVRTERSRRGFENGPGDLSVVSNGTFFNNRILPRIGYQREQEVDDDERWRYFLGPRVELPEPSRDCTAPCDHNYLSPTADWVDLDVTISTAPDQTAIAPGSLVREWRANGRRYFQYKVDHPSADFYSILSARYTVAREEWNGVKVEVYYLKEQPWNVPRMREAIRKSLDYYTRNFGPYFHKEARIIEFPRIAGFAQSYPGTMPYSEAVGFIANLENPDDIDHVFYVVAHEMAHQWWGHQVIGAELQGATLLSESLAQYSALMVMEKEYGHDMIRKFLRYETDQYLRGRAADKKRERPLLNVRDDQMYVRYNKASSVFYLMREMIGEEAMNRALRGLLERYRYADPPYPTSYALVDALRHETPRELRYLIRDLFEDITLYSNVVTGAHARRRPDGKYDVTMSVQFYKLKPGVDGEEESPHPADYVEIGAFAPPARGKYGRLIHLERVFMNQHDKIFQFTVDEKPDSVAIDPLSLLIDKSPDNNKRTVEVDQ